MKLTEIIPDDLPEWAIKAMAEGQFFNVVNKKIKDIRTREPVFTNKISVNSGLIELLVDGELITVWSFDDDPESSINEFKNIFLAGMEYK